MPYKIPDPHRTDHSSEDVLKAIQWAIHAHGSQTDMSGLPYILHPLRVMGDADTNTKRIIAVLHDTLEDTDLSYTRIEHWFGYAVAHAVRALTRDKGESYEDYLVRVKANPAARDVKIQDLHDNLARPPLPDKKTQRRNVVRYKRALYYLSIDDATIEEAEEAYGIAA